MLILIFLSSGLFLGWSLGANDASNVFGTAVATRMLKFKTAAIICCIFVVLGACISGAGAAHTLGKLGTINAVAGAFMVACAAAITVMWMTKLALPVSTSQAIVGAIIGWNLFSGSLTDFQSLLKITMTWVLCPVLAAIFAIILFKMLKCFLKVSKIHLFRIDAYTRVALVIVGAFGSYSLGANNIANVMGVFVPLSLFRPIDAFGLFQISGVEQLFFFGAVAIAIGVYTYSHKVMATVGQKLFKLTPQAALIVVLAQALVLFIFASQGLESWLKSMGLPTIPLVPVSSSQAVIGAVIGIAIAKGGRNIQWRVMGEIAVGWITTPVIAGLISFIALYFLQNVFDQKVYKPVYYQITEEAWQEMEKVKIPVSELNAKKWQRYKNARSIFWDLKKNTRLSEEQIHQVMYYTKHAYIKIDMKLWKKIHRSRFSKKELEALQKLEGRTYQHPWQFYHDLSEQNHEEHYRAPKKMQEKWEHLYSIFATEKD